MAGSGIDGVFSILFVCSGNVCRSPLAAAAFERELGASRTVIGSSAGSRALIGRQCPPETLATADQLGLDLSDHRASQMTTSRVREAGLVLGLAREHRAAAVRLAPKAQKTAFTLLEFARLSATVSDHDLESALRSALSTRERLDLAVSLVRARRGASPGQPTGDELDVVDPYGGPLDGYVRSAQQSMPAATSVARFVRRSLRLP